MDSASEQGQSGSAPRRESMAEIVRCRLYRVKGPSEFHPRGIYVEVWDWLGAPAEHSNSSKPFPQGEVVAEAQNLDMQVVRDRMFAHWKRLGIVSCGSWRHPQGSA